MAKWKCESPKKNLVKMLEDTNVYGELEEELKNLTKGCNNKLGDVIEINDWDIKGKITEKGTAVHLVLEEDGSIRWYLNPDERSDFGLRTVNVKKIGKR